MRKMQPARQKNSAFRVKNHHLGFSQGGNITLQSEFVIRILRLPLPLA